MTLMSLSKWLQVYVVYVGPTYIYIYMCVCLALLLFVDLISLISLVFSHQRYSM